MTGQGSESSGNDPVSSFSDPSLIRSSARGDSYSVVGQAGAVGREAHVSYNDQSIVEEVFADVDMAALVKELEILVGALKESASSPEDDITLVEIAQAFQAAQEGNRVAIWRHLEAAGSRRLLNTTFALGLGIASALLQRVIGS